MEDDLWLLQQKYRALQEYRSEIRIVWDDSAAREINNRYLHSHETDAERMQIALIRQSITLQQVDEKLDNVARQVHLAEELSSEIAHNITTADEELRKVNVHLDLFAQYNSDALSAITSIHQLINNANEACGKE
jgi:hypothetical protein